MLVMLSRMFAMSGLSTTLAHAVVVDETADVVICSPVGNVGPRPSSSIVVGAESTSQVARSTVVRPVVTTARAGTETNMPRISHVTERGAERMRCPSRISPAVEPAGTRRRGRTGGRTGFRGEDPSPKQPRRAPFPGAALADPDHEPNSSLES